MVFNPAHGLKCSMFLQPISRLLLIECNSAAASILSEKFVNQARLDRQRVGAFTRRLHMFASRPRFRFQAIRSANIHDHAAEAKTIETEPARDAQFCVSA